MSLLVIDRGKPFHEMTFVMLVSLLSDGAHKLCQAPVLLKGLFKCSCSLLSTLPLKFARFQELMCVDGGGSDWSAIHPVESTCSVLAVREIAQGISSSYMFQALQNKFQYCCRQGRGT